MMQMQENSINAHSYTNLFFKPLQAEPHFLYFHHGHTSKSHVQSLIDPHVTASCDKSSKINSSQPLDLLFFLGYCAQAIWILKQTGIKGHISSGCMSYSAEAQVCSVNGEISLFSVKQWTQIVAVIAFKYYSGLFYLAQSSTFLQENRLYVHLSSMV